MKKWFLLLAVLYSLPFSASLKAQSAELKGAEPSSLFDFFYRQQNALPTLKLETNWKKLVKEKLKEEYQPGVLSFQSPDGNAIDLEVSLRARGNARKKVCYFPPLKIKADRKGLSKMGIESGRKLKLVLPCHEGKSDVDCLLKEALAYQLYEAVYPVHHRTRIVQLQGLQKGREKHAFYAFLVEDEKEFADRVNAKRVKEEKIRTIDLERDAYVKMCFFQYMIGNTDWSEPNSHNLQILKLPGHEKPVPIPYDFDYSGFVDTDYAKPRSSLPIEDVDQRYFLGKYVTEEEALECAQYYRSKKEQIVQICERFDLIRDKSSQSIHEFISAFFDMLDNEEQVLQAFVTRPVRKSAK